MCGLRFAKFRGPREAALILTEGLGSWRSSRNHVRTKNITSHISSLQDLSARLWWNPLMHGSFTHLLALPELRSATTD